MVTARDQLVDLMATVKADQSAAFQELGEYLQSAEAQNFRSTIAGVHARTVPGGSLDNVLAGMLRVFDAVASITQSEIQRQVQAAAMADIQPDAPVVPDAPVIIVPDAPIPDDAPIAPESNEPLPTDTAGGEVA